MASGPAAMLRRSAYEPAAFVAVYEACSRRLLAYFVRRTFDVEAGLGVEVPAVSEDDYQRIVDLAGLDELRGRVEGAFAQLSPDQSAAVRLRVIDELSYREVAETLGVSEQTVRARVSRALRHLADVLELSPTPQVTP
jgi:RNA polymerase sigma factor (sigma-70 family)